MGTKIPEREDLEFKMEIVRTIGSCCTIINVILSLVLSYRVLNTPVVQQPIITPTNIHQVRP